MRFTIFPSKPCHFVVSVPFLPHILRIELRFAFTSFMSSGTSGTKVFIIQSKALKKAELMNSFILLHAFFAPRVEFIAHDSLVTTRKRIGA